MIRDRIRAWLGDSAALAAANADLAEARRALDRCRDTLHTLRRQYQGNEGRWAETEDDNTYLLGRVRALEAELALPREPGRAVQCDKVRLTTKDDADELGRRFERDRDLPPGTFVAQGCDHCPRQPLTGGKYWHITNADKDHRGHRPKPNGHRAPGIGKTHMTPGDVARIKAAQRTGGAA